ncbi:MAG: glutathione ABC transporter permease [Pseudonocardia sp. SCN 72-86]|nr:MAG: glutathione ABC transporter permease [Pseudonocardia sp. SCN 72-86]
MPRVFVRRTGQAVLTLVGAGALIFLMLAVTPGDPARRVLEARGITAPSAVAVAAVRSELHLDDALAVRFFRWAGAALTGDLGISWQTGRPVVDDFAALLPATLRLTVTALAMAIVLAFGLATLATAGPGRWPDTVAGVVGLAMIAVPSFVIGVVVLDVLVVRWGYGRVISDGTWATVFLPALVLALASATTWSRVLRTGVLEARSAPHLRVSIARGVGRSRRFWAHEIPNAAAPFLTMVGIGAGFLLGGAPIVESVFTWPGVGRFTVQAIDSRDMPVVVGFTMIAVLAFVLTSLVTDLLATLIDPRLRVAT